uniref:Isopenicillin N synthase-like Fe(2+) 2OG dioxygenase domain-containing protein n=1 Tax=Aegilops tauschii TaxID=37682 RepID=N1R537_AEGTA
MAETAPATALDIDEIPFADLLLLLLSPEAAAAGDDSDTDGRRRRLLATVWAALGPGGAGLLAVAGPPSAAKHGLGSDVPLKKPDRSVSSLAQLLRYDSGKLHSSEFMREATGDTEIRPGCPEEVLEGADGFGEHNGDDDDDDDDDDDHDIENLGELFKELGLCMMELGILVARACDIVIGGNQLEQSITDFGSAKARLIHYHSELDNRIIKERSSTKRRSLANNAAAAARRLSDHMDTGQMSGSEDGSCIKSAEENSLISLVNLWQEWHYDYGVLTVLTAPLFLRSALGQECPASEECSLPDGHSHLQLFNKRRIFSVRCSQESFIVQVGEAAGILSGGKLRSTLHAVSRPLGLPNISRETFVVFLQPSWDKTLPFLGYSSADEDDSSDHMELAFRGDGPAGSCSEHILMQGILKKIPPLSSRLKEGMTFAEFSRQTTKRYYGGGGIQQKS